MVKYCITSLNDTAEIDLKCIFSGQITSSSNLSSVTHRLYNIYTLYIQYTHIYIYITRLNYTIEQPLSGYFYMSKPQRVLHETVRLTRTDRFGHRRISETSSVNGSCFTLIQSTLPRGH